MARAGALFAGFDVGTAGTKGVLVDRDARRVVARASSAYGLIGGLAAGAAEQHPDTWIAALREVGRGLFDAPGIDPHRLAGLGVSGQQHGLVVLDGEGRALRAAKLWCDTSTAAEAGELSRRLGRSIPAGFTAPKVLWLARHEPEVWARTRRVLLPHDYVNFRLSGRAWSEAGDASGTGWFDAVARAVDAQACRAIDARLEECLAPLAEPGTLPGRLSEEGAALLGLPRELAGTPIATGGGDNMLSAIGAGATRAGVAVLSLGTSATVFASSPRPVLDPRGAVAPFCDCAGGWLPLLCVMNAAGALDELRAGFGRSHAELEREAAALPLEPEGALCLPYFVGERVPDLPRARASLLGLGPGSLSPARIYRTCMEGIVLNLAEGIARLRELGVPCTQLRAVGGGARNRFWLQLLADACGATLSPLEEAESAALGGALQALWSVERSGGSAQALDALVAPFVQVAGAPVRPEPSRAQAMARLAERFREARATLHGPGL